MLISHEITRKYMQDSAVSGLRLAKPAVKKLFKENFQVLGFRRLYGLVSNEHRAHNYDPRKTNTLLCVNDVMTLAYIGLFF